MPIPGAPRLEHQEGHPAQARGDIISNKSLDDLGGYGSDSVTALSVGAAQLVACNVAAIPRASRSASRIQQRDRRYPRPKKIPVPEKQSFNMAMASDRTRLQDALCQWRLAIVSDVGRTPRRLGTGIRIQPIAVAVVGMFKDAAAGLALAGRRGSGLAAHNQRQRDGKQDFGARSIPPASHALLLLQDQPNFAAAGRQPRRGPLVPQAGISETSGGRTRTRTLDPLIKSQLLYQLSYAP